MKLNSTSQKTAFALVSLALLQPALLQSARADVKHTDVMSMLQEGKMTPMSTSTNWLKEGLQRVDTKIGIGGFDMQESVITNVPQRQYVHVDPSLKIYYIEPFASGGETSSTRSVDKNAPAPAKTTTHKKGKSTTTVGAQFLGLVKMLNLQARHYTTSMRMMMTGDCGTNDTKFKTEVWMADVKLPVLKIPNSNGGMGYGGGVGAGCDITAAMLGDQVAFQAAQKGLALKSIQFDGAGKPITQQEITMLSYAVLKDSEFAVPAGFKKMSKDDYNKARQSAMVSAMMGKDSDGDKSQASDEDGDKANSPDEMAAEIAPTAAPTPASSTRYAPVALKNDAKLDKSLLEAARDGKDADAIAILQGGANPNAFDKNGMTPLMFASQNGKPELVRALLDMGADSKAVNKKGQSALHFATMIGQPKPKKKKFGGLGGMLGGAILGNAVSGSLGNMGNFGSLLGGGGLDGFLGNNLTGLLNGGAFNLGGKSGWMAIIGTALQGDIKSNGAFGLQNIFNGQLNKMGASQWINLVGAVKGSNPQVLAAMSNIGGAGNAQWSQFMQAAAAGDAKSLTGLMGESKMKPLLDQALQGFSAASGELPQNAAKTIVSSLLEKGANANALNGDGKTAAQLLQARDWNDVAALL